jgi:ribulose-5-phosphate 4-epimerase/fuculose-1-phosphate aldolase
MSIVSSEHGAVQYSTEEWNTRINLAACYRLASRFGWNDLIYTHISARVPGPEHLFLLNPFGLLFDEVTASNLVKIDLDGNVVSQTPHEILRAGFVIHSAIHAARPEVQCVIHAHTRSGMAVSAMKDGLLPLTQSAMMFHGRVAYHESEGFAIDLEERRRLAHDLGDKPVMILRNHGTLVAGESIPDAFSLMWNLERAMQAQVDALAGGQDLCLPPKKIAEEIVQVVAMNGARFAEQFEWPAMLRLLDKHDPSFRN